MTCCAPYQVPFSNQGTVTIPWTDGLRSMYGAYPKVDVFIYDDEAGEYYDTNGIPGVSRTFDGTNLFIDLGGPATGYVKIT